MKRVRDRNRLGAPSSNIGHFDRWSYRDRLGHSLRSSRRRCRDVCSLRRHRSSSRTQNCNWSEREHVFPRHPFRNQHSKSQSGFHLKGAYDCSVARNSSLADRTAVHPRSSPFQCHTIGVLHLPHRQFVVVPDRHFYHRSTRRHNCHHQSSIGSWHLCEGRRTLSPNPATLESDGKGSYSSLERELKSGICGFPRSTTGSVRVLGNEYRDTLTPLCNIPADQP
jgi:hypothetical protein